MKVREKKSENSLRVWYDSCAQNKSGAEVWSFDQRNVSSVGKYDGWVRRYDARFTAHLRWKFVQRLAH